MLVLWLLGMIQLPSTSAQTVSADAMLPVHLNAARQYQLYASDSPGEALQLNEQPLFVWTNPRRARGQVGHLFVWMDGEIPAAVGTIFSFPWQGNAAQQRSVHEFHAIAESKLRSVNPVAVKQWLPKAGIDFLKVPDSPSVPENDARRLLGARSLARSFRAHTIDQHGQRWNLRLMGRQLLTYADRDRTGAMFAMLGDAGADPELLLLIEAKRHADHWQWRFAPVRMTDQEIYLRFGQRDVWSSVHDEANTRFHNNDHTYFRFQDVLYDASEIVSEN